jgi:PAS domain S-box-containing protein
LGKKALSTSQRRLWYHILIIAALTVAATGVRQLFSPALGSRVPFLIYSLAVAIAAQSAGMIPGLVVTVLSIALIDYPAPASDPHMHTTLAIFGVVGAFLSVFGGWRKRTESRLERVGYNLDTAQQIANIGSWESDLDGKLWWSPATYRIFGVEPGIELCNDDFFARVHPDDLAKVRAAADLAIRSAADYDVEHRIVRKSDGAVRHVHQRAKVIANGSIHLIGSVQDVTEAREKAAALERISRVMGLALEATNSGAWMWTVETDELIWSENYYRLLGIDPALKPSAELVYAAVHPHDRERLKANLQEALEGRASELWVEFRVQRDGGVRWLERRGRVYRDDAGKTLIVGVTTDITERKILRGLLPTCTQCKKIRDEHDHWHVIEDYLSEHSQARFSHGLCPECMDEWAADSGVQLTNASDSAGRR